jgi:NAD(P)H-dependent FMN reductase
LKITVVVGSSRKKSQSGRIAGIVKERLEAQGAEVQTVSLLNNPIPLWEEEVWEGTEKWKKLWGPTSEILQKSDGFVIVSPEWHGMVPSGLKNFFLLAVNGELKHKPGYIVTVSAGMGGSYPVAELRMSSYKNSRLVYLPEHVIVRHAPDFLKDPANPTPDDQKMLKRMDYGAKMLLAYAKQMAPIRAAFAEEEKVFSSGM